MLSSASTTSSSGARVSISAVAPARSKRLNIRQVVEHPIALGIALAERVRLSTSHALEDHVRRSRQLHNGVEAWIKLPLVRNTAGDEQHSVVVSVELRVDPILPPGLLQPPAPNAALPRNMRRSRCPQPDVLCARARREPPTCPSQTSPSPVPRPRPTVVRLDGSCTRSVRPGSTTTSVSRRSLVPLMQAPGASSL
jgi:hypothetical protein